MAVMRRSRGAAALRSAAALLCILAALVSCSIFGGDSAGAGTGGVSATPATGDTGPNNASVNGVTDTQVLFGQSAALSGPAEQLGRNMRIGIQAAFNEANAAAGVHGRTLTLTTRDDFYTPAQAALNTRDLIDEDEVFALIGAVGTPTSRSAVPVADEAGVPYLAPFTGAEFLRDPSLESVLNLRASYFQETEEMVHRLTTDLNISRIAIFYQDDSFGRAGLEGVRNALDRRGMELASIGLYQRNSTAVKAALLDLRTGDPEAIIMIGAYEPVAELVRWARHIGMNPVFMAVSFVGSNALAQSLGADGEGVFVTQVVPFPEDATLPVTQAYRDALAASFPEETPGFVSFEGYLAGRLAIEGLERCGPDLTRACFLDALLRSGPIDLGGLVIRYAIGDNQGSNEVFLTWIDRQGHFRAATNLRDAQGR